MSNIKSAIEHTIEESGFHHIDESFEMEFDVLQKSHDAIHEFMLLAPYCFPDSNEVSWEKYSAFLLYHLEVFNHAHRSLFEVLCGFYNVGYILLRTTLELLMKGAFWECLCHQCYREDATSITKSDKKKLKQFVKNMPPELIEKLERTSASIYDEIALLVEDFSFRPNMKMIISQLNQWDILKPIPDTTNMIYKDIYADLSADIHAVPDRTDVGRRINSDTPDLFEQHVDKEILHSYAELLHKLIDIAIVVELNILQENIRQFKTVRTKLSERVTVLKKLDLQYSYERLSELIK